MLEDNIDRWIQEQQQRGREEGLELATRAQLGKLLNLKFGPREGRAAELDARPMPELELAMERILFVDHEDDLWR